MVSKWSKLFMLKIYGWELQLQKLSKLTSWNFTTSALEDFEAGETVLFCASGFVVSATATRIKEFATFGQPCFAGAV